MNDFDLGYQRGMREGQNNDRFEQDFAFKTDEYVTGYWAGFRFGRQKTSRLMKPPGDDHG